MKKKLYESSMPGAYSFFTSPPLRTPGTHFIEIVFLMEIVSRKTCENMITIVIERQTSECLAMTHKCIYPKGMHGNNAKDSIATALFNYKIEAKSPKTTKTCFEF